MQPGPEPQPAHAALATGAPPLLARTFLAMGTVVSLTVAFPPGAERGEAADRLEAASRVIEGDFEALEQRFSLYRDDSEASALARGVLRLAHASPEMRACYVEAVDWRRLTHGAFTAERPDGVLDLSGLVKGRAIAAAGRSLAALGLHDWCLNAGGDVLVSGTPSPSSAALASAPRGERPWLAGIADPADRRTLLGAYPLGGAPPSSDPSGSRRPATAGPRLALATSGSAERGDHIWAVGGGKPEFAQASVAGPDMVTADVLATAIVAGGRDMLNLAVAHWDVDVLAVTHDGELLATRGFRAPRAA
ncbi:FAD:protein FMN transferase [Sinomonas sp. ASV322]|uniref:FAD:protein FMN transferase n=1 Tax=Sinomonas sp. ASV322 TaxID=3041920 RepID=UPI0027DDE41E|nr:FAD:protein FMN transferase [Sinomonas sp. ASV322]MDQ4504555.1 FAD:protein FMN transferase [Sinomonas sp. ASV322]